MHDWLQAAVGWVLAQEQDYRPNLPQGNWLWAVWRLQSFGLEEVALTPPGQAEGLGVAAQAPGPAGLGCFEMLHSFAL